MPRWLAFWRKHLDLWSTQRSSSASSFCSLSALPASLARDETTVHTGPLSRNPDNIRLATRRCHNYLAETILVFAQE